MSNFPLKYAQALFMRFRLIWGKNFDGHGKPDDFILAWTEVWSEALDGIDPSSIKDALSYCQSYLKWPPTPAEFRKICEENSGIPTMEEAYKAVQRHIQTSGFHNCEPEPLHHQIEKRSCELVRQEGWDFRRDSVEQSQKRFRKAYQQALKEYRDKTIALPENMKELSHGCETTRNQPRSGSLRKAADFIPRH